MTFDFHPEAQTEFHDAAHWYEDRSTGLGDRFTTAVRSAVHAISNDPGRFQRIDSRIQVFRLNRFPYRIYCTWEPLIQHLRIYAVMHEKRRPGNWHQRVPQD